MADQITQQRVVMEIRDKALELQRRGEFNELAHPDDAFAHFFVILRHVYDEFDPTNDYDLDIG